MTGRVALRGRDCASSRGHDRHPLVRLRRAVAREHGPRENDGDWTQIRLPENRSPAVAAEIAEMMTLNM